MTRANPDDYVAWFYLGHALHAGGELDEALRAHLMAAHQTPQGNQLIGMALYNAACVHALSGRGERALQYLHRARNAGFLDATGMRADADLASLREDERFEAFLAHAAIGASSPTTRVESVSAATAGRTGGVACAPDGTLYVADFASQVWRIAPDGKATVLAEGFSKAADCTLDDEGHLLQVDHGASKVWRIAPDGAKVDLEVQGLSGPVGIDTTPDGALLLTNFRGQSVVRVAGGATTILTEGGLLSGPNGIALAPDGRVYVANYNNGAIVGVDPEGGQRLVAELPGEGNGHIAWSAGALFVTARRDNRLYRVTPLGEVSLVAGQGAQGVVDGGPLEAHFGLPNGVAVSPDGKALFVNDQVTGPTPTWILRKVTL